jgi:hypothetical protein
MVGGAGVGGAWRSRISKPTWACSSLRLNGPSGQKKWTAYYRSAGSPSLLYFCISQLSDLALIQKIAQRVTVYRRKIETVKTISIYEILGLTNK